MELRYYQTQAVESLYRHLRERDDNPCIVCPTGAGKAVICAQIVRDAVQLWNGRVLVLAHVKELLEQTADKLRAICPELKFGVYSAGLKRRDTKEPVILAGIQSVYQRACDLDAFDLVLVDECFVAGTRILTPAGDIPIEQVQPGMFVRNATGMGRVEAVVARPAPNLLTLEYDDGTVLTCTTNHPIFTESGWRAAGSLEIGSLAFGLESVRMLRQGVSTLDQAPAGQDAANPTGEALDKAAVLFDLLLQDPQQLYDLAANSSEGQRIPESTRSRASHPRRQRATHESAEGDALVARTNLEGRVQHSGAALQGRGVTEKPEDRPGPTRPTDCAGAGRNQPPYVRAQTRGHSQVTVLGAKRLVGITHHESASGSVVFNLQVSGHTSYFANGILVHNCHLIPAEGEGMYRTFLRDMRKINPSVRVIGMTATPYRMKTGMICGPENILNAVCYEIGIRELVRDGYLCPLISKAGVARADTSGLHIRGGEFVADEVEALMDQEGLVEAACAEIVEYTKDRQSVLIFASGIAHAQHVVATLGGQHGITCGLVTGDTPMDLRDETVARFRGERGGDLFQGKPLKYLANVGVFTTGFDAPNIDCVVLLRPTASPGLYYQMVGRGFRLHPGKANCLILDFGNNILRHGPIDCIQVRARPNGGGAGEGEAPAKECPECHAVVAAGYSQCPDCGFIFPGREQEVNHEPEATEASVLSGEVTTNVFEVRDETYRVHTKRGAPEDAPKTLRVDYLIALDFWQSEFICFEHQGYARRKAEAWWHGRCDMPVPSTAEEAVRLANEGMIRPAKRITVRHVAGEKFDTIVGYELHPEKCALASLEDVPF